MGSSESAAQLAPALLEALVAWPGRWSVAVMLAAESDVTERTVEGWVLFLDGLESRLRAPSSGARLVTAEAAPLAPRARHLRLVR